MPTPVPSEDLYEWDPTHANSEPVPPGEQETGWVTKYISRGKHNALFNNILSWLALIKARQGGHTATMIVEPAQCSWSQSTLTEVAKVRYSCFNGQDLASHDFDEEVGFTTSVQEDSSDANYKFLEVKNTADPAAPGDRYFTKTIDMTAGETLNSYTYAFKQRNGTVSTRLRILHRNVVTGDVIVIATAPTKTAASPSTQFISLPSINYPYQDGILYMELKVTLQDPGSSHELHYGSATITEPVKSRTVHADKISANNLKIHRTAVGTGAVSTSMPIPAFPGLDSIDVDVISASGPYTITARIKTDVGVRAIGAYSGSSTGIVPFIISGGDWAGPAMLTIEVLPNTALNAQVTISNITFNFTAP